MFFFPEFCVTRLNNGWERELQKSGNAQKNYLFFHFSCKMQSDLRRHREFHNAVLAYHCDFEGCTFSARAMQTVKRHQKVDHQVRYLLNVTISSELLDALFFFVHLFTFVLKYISRELICTDMNVMFVDSDTQEDLG